MSLVRKTLISLTWLPVLFTALDHVYLPCRISGSLMAPSLNPGTSSTTEDIVLVQKYNVKWPKSLRRGDVVMFRSPQDPEKLVTKRIIGVQGDLILPRSPDYPKRQALVPRNHFWVEGDNGFHSIDSNVFGPISQGLVVGKVRMVLWPPLRFGSDITSGGRDGSAREIRLL